MTYGRTSASRTVNRDVVTGHCRRLDALPLALELAAPWIKVPTPEDLLRRLERDALFSAAGPRDLPERQQTMNSTVAWSYHMLDADDQRAFRRFGALPAFFPIDAAAATIAAALRATARLIDKSLLQRSDAAAGGIAPQGIRWARDTFASLAPCLAATRYVNYLEHDTPDPAEVAYGPNLPRLRAIKAKFDPANVFRHNVNIPPR